MSNIVAIVGRPNVGKSTLFNRLTERREAIVDATSGVTRDRNYGKSDWNGIDFSIIDTGGYVTGSDDVFEEEIRKQVYLAIEEAHAIVFLVDVVTGITDLDEDVARILRRTDKPVFLVVNKVDNSQRLNDAAVFYGLGLGDYYCISSINGSGTGDFLDALVSTFEGKKSDPEPDIPRFAFIGRPNVGKSSIINVLLDEERNIVTDIAGTTRDSIDIRFNKFGHDFMLVDTAGLRKKGKVHEDLEFYSVMRSVRAIEHADVCLLIIDATRGIEAQDLSIFHLVENNKKGLVILVNKWDLVEKDHSTTREFEKRIRERIAPFTDVPIIFTSALTKQRVFKAVEEAVQVYDRKKKRIPTHHLNELMLPIIKETPPPSHKGKYVKIKFCTQLPTHNPQFAFFANLPQYVKDPYRRFVENKLRDLFDFSGVPVQVYFRKK